ncbi:hypothetical protein PHISCL_05282 [Aspergillus sclerotialis]|uniref:Uncharacterized protein n=1 Tax=Aspergillus sclerotialis TaxID=2070753 RepID=A0A3A2ZGP9_9EURO|nr:hypothetical protein PHISCL_05282 [Aspergillus sclerotialis]
MNFQDTRKFSPLTFPNPPQPLRINHPSQRSVTGPPSSTARTVPFMNSGRGEIVESQTRGFSMTAEEDRATVTDSTENVTPKTVRTRNEFVYSPSVYDRPQGAGGTGGNGEEGYDSDGREEERKKRSKEFIVRGNQMDIFEESTFTPSTNASTTQPTRGGYAPTPPHPEYQSTVSLQQQLVSHSNSLHYHVDSAINRLARTFEKANNWTTDQVMRQVDNMADAAEQLASQASRQNEILAELKQMVYELNNQIDAVRNESREMEGRLREGILDDIRKIRAESVVAKSSTLLPVAVANGMRRDSKFIPPSGSRYSGIGVQTRESRETLCPRETGTGRYSHQPLTKRESRGWSSMNNLNTPYNTERREPGQLLRQVKSKPSLTSMGKRTEHPQMQMQMQPVDEDVHPPQFLSFPSSVDTVATTSTSNSNVSSSSTRSIENDRPAPLEVKKRSLKKTQKSSPSLNGRQTPLGHEPKKSTECFTGKSLFLPESFMTSTDDLRESGLRSATQQLPSTQGQAQSEHVPQSNENIPDGKAPISSDKGPSAINTGLNEGLLLQHPAFRYDQSNFHTGIDQLNPENLGQSPTMQNGKPPAGFGQEQIYPNTLNHNSRHLVNNPRPPIPNPIVDDFKDESPRKSNQGIPAEDTQKTPRKPNNQKITSQPGDTTNRTPKRRVMRMGIFSDNRRREVQPSSNSNVGADENRGLELGGSNAPGNNGSKVPEAQSQGVFGRERHCEGHDNNQLERGHALKENQKTPRKRVGMGMFGFGRRREVDTSNTASQYRTGSNLTDSDTDKQPSTTDNSQSGKEKQYESNRKPSTTYVLYASPPTLPPPSYPPPPTPTEHNDNG